MSTQALATKWDNMFGRRLDHLLWSEQVKLTIEMAYYHGAKTSVDLILADKSPDELYEEIATRIADVGVRIKQGKAIKGALQPKGGQG